MWVSLISCCLRFCALDVCFLHQVREVFSYYFFNPSSVPFSFSSPSGTPIMWMLLWLTLSQSFLKLNFHFKNSFLFALLIISTTLSSRSLVHYFVSSNLLLIHFNFIVFRCIFLRYFYNFIDVLIAFIHTSDFVGHTYD